MAALPTTRARSSSTRFVLAPSPSGGPKLKFVFAGGQSRGTARTQVLSTGERFLGHTSGSARGYREPSAGNRAGVTGQLCRDGREGVNQHECRSRSI